MVIRTRLTELLGIDHPIIQGGMARVSKAPLVIAVGKAGAIGAIGTGEMSADVFRGECRLAKAGLGDLPYIANLMLQQPNIDDLVQVILDEGVPVVTTGAGTPAKYMPALLEAGVKVIPIAASVAFAKRFESQGAAAVIGEGWEAGGHIGDISTMVLVPLLLDAVTLPVIAAGGIVSGRGLAAALGMGAAGVQMGTRFEASIESSAHQNVKELIVSSRERCTAITYTPTEQPHPIRGIENELTRYFKELASRGSDTLSERQALGDNALGRCMEDGDIKWGSAMAGQCAAAVNKIQSAGEVVAEVVEEAEALLFRLASGVI